MEDLTLEDHFEGLPDDLILEIFSRLDDIKSLIRCLSVSKRLASLVPFTTSITMQIQPPRLSSSEPIPLYKEVSDFVETNISIPNVKVDVIKNFWPTTEDITINPIANIHDQYDHLPVNVSTLCNDIPFDMCMQYYVSAACQKLSTLRSAETVRVELPWLDDILRSIGDHYLFTLEFEYSGGPGLIKSCLTWGCIDYEENLSDDMKKKHMKTRKEPVVLFEEVILHVYWMTICLKFALSLYPMVEEMVRKHETIQDILITDPSERAKLHVGKDEIEKIRREKTSCASIMEFMVNNSMNMKTTLEYAPFYEVDDCLCKGVNAGKTTVGSYLTEEEDKIKKIHRFILNNNIESLSILAEKVRNYFFMIHADSIWHFNHS